MRAARLVCAASAGAWKEIAEMPPGPARDGLTDSLPDRAFANMIACADPGPRAAQPPVAVGSLAQAVMGMSDDELFQ